MRTTLEIVIAVQAGRPATEQELRLALLAVDSMRSLAERELRTLAESVDAGNASAKMRATFAKGMLETSFKGRKRPPAEWLGPDHTPGTPENVRLQRVAADVLKKATGIEVEG